MIQRAMGFATYYSLMLFLVLLPLLAIAQTTNNGRIDVNASLIAADNTSYWLSPSKEFAFGFHRPENEDRFLLSIWFEQIPEKTVVWWSYEKETEFSVLVEAGSKVVLTTSGLVLRDPQGEERWRSVLNTGQVDYAVMEDTGNMVLVGPNSDQVLWRSFDNPSDTLLPTQEMGFQGQLFSRKKENDFSLGKFQLHLFDNGTLTINVINLPTRYIHGGPYYSSDDNNPNASNSGVGLIFDKSGDVYMLRKNGDKSPIGSGSKLPIQSSDYYQRVTLDVDGVFAQYYYPKKSNGNWSTAWLQPINICSWTSPIGSGACGFNSICSINDKTGRPNCECAPGFFLIDPNDPYGGCIRDDELNYCQKDAFELETRKNINWPLADYERYGVSYTEIECKDSCRDDCMCVVAIYNADGSCFKKRLPLSNGRYGSDDRSVSFVKVRKGGRTSPSIPDDEVPNLDKDKKERIFSVTGSILLGTSVFVNLIRLFREIVPIYGGIPPLISLSQYGISCVNQTKSV
ncbi:S-locus glycoprotein [Corchorus olitorius]|uniref:S-locus glycoprotein n=1 Tax=Corchorus olitorius TaxID=93759 RepID=A0A1R3K8R6_9ROSI|nr:S-locus glycoprotein [Corchorus olitorius]